MLRFVFSLYLLGYMQIAIPGTRNVSGLKQPFAEDGLST